MLYLPSDFINSNYTYSISNNYYQVRTNRNCNTQYTSTYCDCYNIYFDNNYVVSNAYSCNVSSSVNGTLSSSMFTSDFYYRQDIDKIFLLFFIIMVFLYFLAYKPISRIFGRWLKL